MMLLSNNTAIRAGCLTALAMATATVANAASTAETNTNSATAVTSEQTFGLEEVTVTARRREENAQKVPLAITAFTPETLQQQDMRTATDLEHSIPGLNMCCGRGSTYFAWLRGIPGVVGYFSEAPVTLSGSALLFDVSGVSALKGPQGTLFGLSTNGGALLYTPAAAGTEFGGYAQAIIGDYGRNTTEGVLNLPLMNGKLLVRLGAQVSHTDGYIRDLTQNKDLNDENYRVGRITITALPSDSFKNTLLLNLYEYHNNAQTNVITDYNPISYTGLKYGAAAQSWADAARKLGPYAIPGSSMPGGTFARGKQLNLIDTASWNVNDDLLLKNIYSYQRVSDLSNLDLDTFPLAIMDYGSALNRQGAPTIQHTEELQLQGKALEQRLTYTVGTFHSWRKAEPGVAFYTDIFDTLSGSESDSSATTHALFAQGTYDLSSWVDGLSVTAGYRYSWDQRKLAQYTFDGAQQIIASPPPGSHSWSAPSYTLSLQYQVTPRTMLFVTNSKGYSSGGFNLGSYIPQQYAYYSPESLNNFEAGIKTDWQLGDVKGRVNLTGFYGIYDDIQTYLVVPAPAAPSHTAVVQLNAAKGHIQGVDAEFSVVLWNSLRLYANGTVIDAKYDNYKYNDPFLGEIDASGRDFVFVPKVKYGVGGAYQLPVRPEYGDVSITADYTRQTKVNGNANKNDPIPQDYRPAFDNLNLALNWERIAGHSGLGGSVIVTNVTQNVYGAGGNAFYDSVGLKDAQVVAPRMWALRLRYSF